MHTRRTWPGKSRREETTIVAAAAAVVVVVEHRQKEKANEDFLAIHSKVHRTEMEASPWESTFPLPP